MSGNVKVRLLVSRTGGQNSGDVIEVSAAEAERMSAAGQCEIIRTGRAPERATKRGKAAEKAAK